MRNSIAFAFLIGAFAICFVNVEAGGLLSGVGDLLNGDKSRRGRRRGDDGLLGGAYADIFINLNIHI